MGGGAGKQNDKYKPEIIVLAPKEMMVPLLTVKIKPHQLKFPATLLTADVGGTNSRLHLFRPPPRQGHHEILRIPENYMIRTEKFQNSKYESFLDILREFLAHCNLPQSPYIACFAVAGAVIDNSTKLVNLGWKIDGLEVAAALGFHQVHLINDFEAQGYGILTLDSESECDKLQDAPVMPGGPIAVLGAGTGLGECFLTPGENGDYEVWPTEGGHAEFAPRQDGVSKLQFELCQYLLIKFSGNSRISVERIVSGRGIANIYQFLAWKFPEKINKTVHRRFLGTLDGLVEEDPAVIVEAARGQQCELCDSALEIFFSAYGSEAGVLAMTYMPFGGLFVTGGVTNKLRDLLTGPKQEVFMDAFLDKGRITPMLKRIPVFVVHGDDLGERGVKMRAMRMFSEAEMMRQPSKGHTWQQ